jgi:hypothetical protein
MSRNPSRYKGSIDLSRSNVQVLVGTPRNSKPWIVCAEKITSYSRPPKPGRRNANCFKLQKISYVLWAIAAYGHHRCVRMPVQIEKKEKEEGPRIRSISCM